MDAQPDPPRRRPTRWQRWSRRFLRWGETFLYSLIQPAKIPPPAPDAPPAWR